MPYFRHNTLCYLNLFFTLYTLPLPIEKQGGTGGTGGAGGTHCSTTVFVLCVA